MAMENINFERYAKKRCRESLRKLLAKQQRWGIRLNAQDPADLMQVLHDYDWLLSQATGWKEIIVEQDPAEGK